MTVHPSTREPLIAIVGNPNSGKTSLFNSLTGASQRVGNYPGVTVEKVEGSFRIGDKTIRCIDIPGLYSLKPISADEVVAANVLRGQNEEVPDLIVLALDANNLERNLFLASQVAEVGRPMVVALTMGDLLAKSGGEINADKLSELLGVDVVAVVSHKGIGIATLKEAIDRNLAFPKTAKREFQFPRELEEAAEKMYDRLARAGIDVPIADVRSALWSPHAPLRESLIGRKELVVEFDEAAEELRKIGVVAIGDEEKLRYQWADRVRDSVLSKTSAAPRRSTADSIDRVLTHRVGGLIVFAAIMFVVFQSIYTFSGPMMDWIGAGFDWLGNVVGGWLGGSPILQSLVRDGIIGGVGTMLMFLPQICILFFFIAVLEGTGYLARAAFLMDRLFGWCGLNGRAFIPLLSSFACAIPGIMAARVMPDARSRLATILVAPLMSCSARLPVYILLIGAFIEPSYGPVWAAVALFAMHLLGLVVAIPVVYFLNGRLLRGKKKLPFMLEMPTYQFPKWRDVGIAVLSRAKVFISTAGTIIVVLSIVIWALLYFPRSKEAEAQYRLAYSQQSAEFQSRVSADNYLLERQTEDSYLGRFGKFIEPVFIPAGFDWRLSTAILSAFPAREVVVPSLGIIFSLGGEVDENSGDLRIALQRATWPDGRPLLTVWTAIGIMVFFALCCQCMATLATVKRETNGWKWPAFMFAYMSGLAYLFAVGIHQLARWLGAA